MTDSYTMCYPLTTAESYSQFESSSLVSRFEPSLELKNSH